MYIIQGKQEDLVASGDLKIFFPQKVDDRLPIAKSYSLLGGLETAPCIKKKPLQKTMCRNKYMQNRCDKILV